MIYFAVCCIKRYRINEFVNASQTIVFRLQQLIKIIKLILKKKIINNFVNSYESQRQNYFLVKDLRKHFKNLNECLGCWCISS